MRQVLTLGKVWGTRAWGGDTDEAVGRCARLGVGDQGDFRREVLLGLVLEGGEERGRWLRKVRVLFTPPRVFTEGCSRWHSGQAGPLFPGCDCLLPCRPISFD